MNFSLESVLKHFRYGARIVPARDWFVLVSFATVILAGVISYHLWLFDNVANGGVIGQARVQAPPVFSRSSLDAIQKIFSDRASEEAKYATGVYTFIDPSVE